MIVHQAPGEAGHVRTPQAIAQPLALVGAILVREEQRQPAVAALGDVRRHIGENDPSNAGHGRSLHGSIGASILYTVPENPVAPPDLGQFTRISNSVRHIPVYVQKLQFALVSIQTSQGEALTAQFHAHIGKFVAHNQSN